jgi:hypothetical protein
MKKYTARFQRLFEVEIEANDVKHAETITKQVLAQFPEGTCILLSIYAEGYLEPVETAAAPLSPAEQKVALRNADLANNIRALLPHGDDAA